MNNIKNLIKVVIVSIIVSGFFVIKPNYTIERKFPALEIKKSLAYIKVIRLDSTTKQFSGAIGSGIVVHKSGLIVTNEHVIRNSKLITVKLRGKDYQATVAYVDPKIDIAFIKLNTKDKFRAVKLADFKKIKIGQTVYMYGHPLGIPNVLTKGIISKKAINKQGAIIFFTDSELQQGNSGGGLFNSKGEYLGVPSLKFIIPYKVNNTVVPVNTSISVTVSLKNFRVALDHYISMLNKQQKLITK